MLEAIGGGGGYPRAIVEAVAGNKGEAGPGSAIHDRAVKIGDAGRFGETEAAQKQQQHSRGGCPAAGAQTRPERWRIRESFRSST